MTHIIDKAECTACAACLDECPSEAITLDQSEDFYVIDPGTCTDCGECPGSCPVEAITGPPVEVEEAEEKSDS